LTLRVVIVYAVIDEALSPDFPLGDSLEVIVRRETLSGSSRRYEATIRVSWRDGSRRVNLRA
jgi:hypothetical protein